MLKLDRPIAFVDVEATGLKFSIDRVVSIAIIILNVDLTREDCWYTLVNPEIPIPPESFEKHGITDDMVQDAPKFREIADEVLIQFEGKDVGGYNAPFDLQMIDEEMVRCGKVLNLEGVRIIDPSMIFKKKEERTLSAAVLFYLNQKMAGAHNAAMDIKSTIDVLLAQVARYDDLPRDAVGLAEWSRHDDRLDLAGKFVRVNGNVVYNFGQSKDEPIESNPGLLTWMLNKDFSSDTKRVARKLIEGIRSNERRGQGTLFEQR